MSEILPIDKLENFPHPKDCQTILGHDGAAKQLLDSFKSKKMHHAWVLAGPSGIGKASLAYKLAKFILDKGHLSVEELAQYQDLDTPISGLNQQLIEAQSHPSLFVLKRTYNDKTKKYGQNIAIDQVRKLENFMHQTVEKNAWRVIIIDRADDLNVNSANALLKSVEEPPKNTLFLLLSSSPARLLPTIRSRCRMLHMNPLADEEIAHILNAFQVELDPELKNIIFFLGEGSVAKTLEVIDVEGLDIYKNLIALVHQLPNIDRSNLQAIAQKLSTKAAENQYAFFVEQFLSLIQRMIKFFAKISSGMPITQITDDIPQIEIDLFSKLKDYINLEDLFEFWESSSKIFRDYQTFNMDKKQTIITQMIGFEKLAK